MHSKAHLLTKFKDRQWIRAETKIANNNETSYLMELWRAYDKSGFLSYRKKLKEVATYSQILNRPINGLLSFIKFGPVYRSYLGNGRRFAHIRWIPVIMISQTPIFFSLRSISIQLKNQWKLAVEIQEILVQ